ncbi:MAG: DUF4198 domain-containing protein [Hymenobacter sp.]|nr:MAG: DUF4198 domain-containing protein [Hymenobacter sp.]
MLKQLIISFLLLLATAALAHEFWLQPASFRVAVGSTVPLKLLVGQNFTGQTWPRPTRRVRRFVRFGATNLADSTDLRPALLADSVAPALACPTAGTQLVVLTSAPSFIEMPAEQFTAYLREEGLDFALYYRQKNQQTTTKPGREAYRRCAKTLVLATGSYALADRVDTTYRRVLGLPLELVPEQNPYRLRPGASLTVRVLRAGKPVTGALVHVWEANAATPGPGNTPAHFASRTNNNGRVLLRLAGSGPYLLAASFMERAPAALFSRADWLSTWATLTFGGPATLAAGKQ